MKTKRFAALLAALAIPAVLAIAPTAQSAPSFTARVGSFTSIGPGPTVEWDPSAATKFLGTISSIDTAGAPNVLVSMDDLHGDSFTDAPAIMSVSGDYIGYLGPAPAFDINITLRYAGTDPLVVGGQTFTTGALLDSMGANRFNSSRFMGTSTLFGSAASDVFSLPPGYNDWLFATLNFTPAPAPHFSPTGRPYLDAGRGQLSASWNVLALMPEPETWLLMLIGFGGLGAALRHRRGRAAAMAAT